MKKQILSILIAGVLTLGTLCAANASYILFDQPTDTIDVAGQTVIGSSLTIETRVLFTDEYNEPGRIFNEWTLGYEDKLLYGGSKMIMGYSHPTALSMTVISSDSTLTIGSSHHLAYVYDGSEERLYLDGQLQGSRTA